MWVYQLVTRKESVRNYITQLFHQVTYQAPSRGEGRCYFVTLLQRLDSGVRNKIALINIKLAEIPSDIACCVRIKINCVLKRVCHTCDVPSPSPMAPLKTFGLTSSGRGNKWTRGNTRARGGNRGTWRGRGRGGGGRNPNGGASTSNKANDAAADEGSLLEAKFEDVRIRDEVDEKLGFARVSEGARREAWLVNMHPVSFRSNFVPPSNC